MDHVAIWQFAGNWKGMGIDGNITVKKLELKSVVSKPKATPTQIFTQPKTWTDVQGVIWHAENGTFVIGSVVNLRWGVSTESMLVATLPADSIVEYNVWARGSTGRVWLQRPRGSNCNGYLVGRVDKDAWEASK